MGAKKTSTDRQLAQRGEGRAAPVARAPRKLVADLRQLIDQSRQVVAQTVNAALVWLYWNKGKRIREDLLQQKRADYGEQIVQMLSAQLTEEYGRGFGMRNIFRMVRFAEVFPDERIVSSLMTQLSWTNFIYIIPLDDPLKRDSYAVTNRHVAPLLTVLPLSRAVRLAEGYEDCPFPPVDRGDLAVNAARNTLRFRSLRLAARLVLALRKCWR